MRPENEQLYQTTEYEMVTKDADGEAHVHKLKAERFRIKPEERDVAELLVRQAPPVKITPSRRVKPTRDMKVGLVMPDMQIGYRKNSEGIYEPFHDERAIALAHLIMREVVPDFVIYMGDNVDLPSISRWQQRPEFAQTVQMGIDRLSAEFAQTRADIGKYALILAIEGNHEKRFEDSIIKNNAELLHIKRANAGEKLGVLTLEYLLRCGEMDIKYLSGYPNVSFWLQGHTEFFHGQKASQKTSVANQYVWENDHNIWFAHDHRRSLAERTIPTADGHRVIYSANAGTLSRIDGSVQSYSSSIDNKGATVERAENWQQGIGLVYYNEENSVPVFLPINDDGIMYNGEVYRL